VTRPSYYSVTTAEVRYDKRLCPMARILYGEIAALCNAHGYCYATNGYFADLYVVEPTTVSEWISQLATAGHIRIELTGRGRRLYLSTTLREKPKPPSGKAEAPLREKPKQNTTSNTTSNTITSPPAPDFDLWWEKYPRRLGKKAALRCWLARAKDGVTAEELTRARDGYVAHCSAERTEMKYVMHPTTFLGPAERWRDYLVAQATGVVHVEKRGRICPACGAENHHTGGDCLQCQAELPRGGAA